MWVVGLYFGFLAVGVLFGSKIVPQGKEIKHTNILFPALVFIVIFLMGVTIGSDEQVISSIGEIGASSFLITIAAMTGSVVAVTILRKFLKIDRKGIRRDE